MKQSLSFCVELMIWIGNTVNHLWNKHKRCSQRKIDQGLWGFCLVWGKWMRDWKNMTVWSHYHVVENKNPTPNKVHVLLIWFRIYLGKVYHLELHCCFGSLNTIIVLIKSIFGLRNNVIQIKSVSENRGAQREYSSKPLEHSIVKHILVFKQ